MAQIVMNPLVEEFSGKLGTQLFFRRLRDGRIIACARPDFSRRKLSRDQKEHHRRFKQAAAYARNAARSEPIYAELAAGTMKNAYNVALGDWFHPPVIHEVKQRGGMVRIQASDDVRVASVTVTISNEQGTVLERGQAVQAAGDWWEYTPSKSGRLTVEAQDLAGNRVKWELTEES